mgnify:FL=1
MIINDEKSYRAHPALNFSSAKHLLDSPKHFKASLAEKVEQTEDMLIGTAVHAKILEGRDYPLAVMPEGMDGRTSEGRAWKKANSHLETMSRDGFAMVKRLIEAVQSSADVQYLLSRCHFREQGIVQSFRNTEIKGKIDALGQDEQGRYMIVDVKTAKDANPSVWSIEASRRRYFLQMSWYQTLVALEYKLDYAPPFFWVVAEKTDAADVCIFQPPPEALQIGQKQLDICIERYQECQRTNQWPGYGSGLLDLEVSYFDRRKYLN